NDTDINGGGAMESIVGGTNTWSSAITLLTGASVGADGGTSLTLSGGVSGVGDLTKVGVGTVVLSVADTYTGQTNVGTNATPVAGILSVTNGSALGLAGAGVTLNSGSTLQI